MVNFIRIDSQQATLSLQQRHIVPLRTENGLKADPSKHHNHLFLITNSENPPTHNTNHNITTAKEMPSMYHAIAGDHRA